MIKATLFAPVDFNGSGGEECGTVSLAIPAKAKKANWKVEIALPHDPKGLGLRAIAKPHLPRRTKILVTYPSSTNKRPAWRIFEGNEWSGG